MKYKSSYLIHLLKRYHCAHSYACHYYQILAYIKHYIILGIIPFELTLGLVLLVQAKQSKLHKCTGETHLEFLFDIDESHTLY